MEMPINAMPRVDMVPQEVPISMDVRRTHQKSYEKENTWINRFEPYINKRGYCAAHDPAGHKAADQEKDQDGRYDGGNGIKDRLLKLIVGCFLCDCHDTCKDSFQQQ